MPDGNLTLKELEERIGIKIPHLLSREEAEAAREFCIKESTGDVIFKTAPCAGMWVLEYYSPDGRLLGAF